MVPVLIVGGGAYGLSIALELATRGTPVTVLDRFNEPPSPDAASSDLNKIVRSDYTNDLYTKLGAEAIKEWQQEPWKAHFSQVGMVILSNSTDAQATRAYVQMQTNLARSDPEAKLAELKTPQEIASSLRVPTDPRLFQQYYGYVNTNSGFARASDAMNTARNLCIAAGVHFETGNATRLTFDQDTCTGVQLLDGRTLEADLVVVACGAWSASLCPDLSPYLTATGQTIATIRIPPEERGLYKEAPVVISFHSGFYVLPMNDGGIVKLATHEPGTGFLNPQPATADPLTLVSTPRTTRYLGTANDHIPRSSVQKLRQHLAGWFPSLAARDFETTRLCWYSDTADENWLIDYHPKHKHLFVASGDSGHGFKFLPILGRYVVQAIDRVLAPELQAAWGFARFSQPMPTAPSSNQTLQDLAQASDLKANPHST